MTTTPTTVEHSGSQEESQEKHIGYGLKARFLSDVPKGTPLDELADEWHDWRRRKGYTREQADLGRWSE